MVIKGSAMATTYVSKLAESFRLSKYTIGFIIVAIISVLPETFVAINSAIKGISSFGLGVLFGGNVADLTLVFTILVLYAGKGLKVESKILKNHVVYPFILLLPLILGLDGYYSRVEGITLIIVGAIFYYITLRNGTRSAVSLNHGNNKNKNFWMLLFSMAILLVGAYFIVTSATSLATMIGISPIIIGMLVVGLGTTIPELFFSLKSIKRNNNSLAIGDILGTVLADATIVVGILALINPFSFSQEIIYVTGSFMLTASLILFKFMRSGRMLNRLEAFMLLLFWLVFIATEFLASIFLI